jgi:hypothetical protein
MGLSRRQRAAAASVGMIVVTIFTYVIYYSGHHLEALSVEVSCAVIYSIWVNHGKNIGE